jgi:hypothetical protein
MRRFWIAAAMLSVAATAALVPLTAEAQNKGRAQKPTATVPFEAERAKERGNDRGIVRLNEDVTRLPSYRVIDLPVVDGRLGEHARLDDLEIFFPYGSIVIATAEFHRYRPALLASSETSDVPDGVADPKYDRVKSFDRQLGKVCASDQTADGGKIEMRISHENVLSVVHVSPAKYQGPTADRNPSYKVVSGLEMRFLSFKEPEATRLHRMCQRPGGTKVSAAD